MTGSPHNLLCVDPRAPGSAAIARAAAVLRAGGLVAFPTETVYGLGAHAQDAAAVGKIFRAKDRPTWDPLIVHVSGMPMALALAHHVPPLFGPLTAAFWPGPLTLIVEKAAGVPDEVTAGRSTVALRMPRHPVAAALLREAALPIAAPSANRVGRPSPTCATHVVDDLGDRVELILDAGPTALGVESTILDLTVSPPAIRRPGGISRGDIEAVIGQVVLADTVELEAIAHGLAAPGMSAKHYAPRARVELFEGDPRTVVERMRARASELKVANQRVGVILPDGAGETPEADVRLMYGPAGDWAQLAARLFAFLRTMDDRGVAVILSVLPPPEGLGLAIRGPAPTSGRGARMSADAATLAKALEWVNRELRIFPNATKLAIVEQAAQRFDLGPLDEEWLLRQVITPPTGPAVPPAA